MSPCGAHVVDDEQLVGVLVADLLGEQAGRDHADRRGRRRSGARGRRRPSSTAAAAGHQRVPARASSTPTCSASSTYDGSIRVPDAQ
jgi:hypothetical protein